MTWRFLFLSAAALLYVRRAAALAQSWDQQVDTIEGHLALYLGEPR